MPKSDSARNIVGPVIIAAAAIAGGLGVVALRAAGASDQVADARSAIIEAVELGDMSVNSGGTHVAYTLGGAEGLFVASLTGDQTVVQVRVDLRFPCHPVLSPDARWIALESCFGPVKSDALYLVDARSGETREVSKRAHVASWQAQTPAWAPDSARLAHVRFTGEDESALHVFDARSGTDTRVIFEEGRVIRAPSFSPDGRRVAYYSNGFLRVTDLESGDTTTLHGGDGTEPSPTYWQPDAPAWSPDGESLAFGYADEQGYRLWVVSVAGGDARRISDDGFRPRWTPAGDAVVHLRSARSERTLWLQPIAGGAATALDRRGGVTYALDFAVGDRLLALTSPPDHPRALWWIPLDGAAPQRFHDSPAFEVPAPWVSVPDHAQVTSADGLVVPLVIFPRTCGEPDKPGPALVLIHHQGGTDVSPRWYPELQYAAASGLTVVAVNYRGSAGNGRAYARLGSDEEGEIADVTAAIEWARRQPGIDPDHIYVELVSSSAEMAYRVIAAQSDTIRGVIDWVGSPGHWATEEVARAWPDMLWVSASDDPITARRSSLVKDLSRAGTTVEHVIAKGDHGLKERDGRRKALEAVAAFVHSRSGSPCERTR